MPINEPFLIGPISKLLTMDNLPEKGCIADYQLKILIDVGIVIKDGIIDKIDTYALLKNYFPNKHIIDYPAVALPGFIDCHTHLCFAGSRAKDYALRLGGMNYRQIAANRGGILESVRKTRKASKQELVQLLLQRTKLMKEWGVTTCEVKSGYGLSVDSEVKILETIREASSLQPLELIPTCLAAHIKPPEFKSSKLYLDYLVAELFPILKQRNLTKRIDIFVDDSAFSVEEARSYLLSAKEQGFDIILHIDQFSRGDAVLAAELHAQSADHLEQSRSQDFEILAEADVHAVVLPGASLGLGIPFSSVRQMLDNGLSVAIASDWNPGSAPMGNLLVAASLLGMAEKLSMAETLAGLTVRAAKALGLNDRGCIKPGLRGDIIIFPCNDYREILYQQGLLKPKTVLIRGIL